MNKQSIITPVAEIKPLKNSDLVGLFLERLKVFRAFALVVLVPTLLLAGYLYLVAADQYQSEAHFVVRSASAPAPVATGIGQLLGFAGEMGGSGEGATVTDYLISHDAVAALDHNLNLVQRFRRPEADPLSRLNTSDPTPEKLLKYYKGKVSAHTDRDSGITVLQVRAFRPDDAYAIIQGLLALGELRVNSLNDRAYNDAISSARRELEDAESAVNAIQARMTTLRQTRGDIDPQGAGEAQIKLASELNGNLVGARTQLATMGATISHSSPQYLALARQVRSLENETAVQSKQASGGSSHLATDLANFEGLRVEQDFASKRYETAAADLEKAREQARRQQLYLTRIVEPNRPIKALFPERGRIILTVFIGLILAYSMGWLLAAGVKEHAA